MYVYVVIFATETSIIENVLFIDIFTIKSKQENISSFIEYEIDELSINKSKWVSITTDCNTKLIIQCFVVDNLKEFNDNCNVYSVWFILNIFELSFEMLHKIQYLKYLFIFVELIMSYQMRNEYNSFINNHQDDPDYLNLLKIRSISHIMLLYYGDNINSLFK